MYGFEKEIRAIVIGGTGGLGAQFVKDLCDLPQCTKLIATSRNVQQELSDHSKINWFNVDITQEDTIYDLAEQLKNFHFQPNLIINCCGLLHNNQDVLPEKTWRHLDKDQMTKVFSVNTFGVALLAKHLIPCIPRDQRAVFASISARVGSISDNRLGGWYSYRASKAAHNMMIKTIAIEAKRKRKQLICASLHPGTVNTKLSQPYTQRYDPNKLFTTEKSCTLLEAVITKLTPEDSGAFFAWDGSSIPF